MSKNDEDIAGAIIGIGAGILLGMLGAAILDSLSGPRCPNCKHKIEKNAPYCPNCDALLRWN
jgi:hypothetical protein